MGDCKIIISSPELRYANIGEPLGVGHNLIVFQVSSCNKDRTTFEICVQVHQVWENLTLSVTSLFPG